MSDPDNELTVPVKVPKTLPRNMESGRLDQAVAWCEDHVGTSRFSVDPAESPGTTVFRFRHEDDLGGFVAAFPDLVSDSRPQTR
ncbi:hypothetical protein [Histidinibacterium aquaticum]|uniref:Uncharacterized protein n=1 Tax=Histidinibacterium aquaticum TaxID=2613962 RepID=A0A5J5GHT2_9RHOB|nr:hypothetical protein [Histidinibacterium aquaticum]KAA9007796.1 hypothetical protein F3S47_09715 [Histidinibacterium aquaticum]